MKKLALISVLLVFISPLSYARNYQAMLTGKTLHMQDTVCTGISLSQQSRLILEDPLGNCSLNLPARVKWLSKDTFMMIESEQMNDTSPPRVYVYKIKSIKGNKVVITDIWTGWGDSKDTDITYFIEK